MLKKLGLVVIFCSLSACSFFNVNNSPTGDRLARCKEIKHRIIFNGATGNQLVETQENAEMAGLERDYRKLNCN